MKETDTVRPINNEVLIKPDLPNGIEEVGGLRKTKGGILIPVGGWDGQISDGSTYGTVLAVGPTVIEVAVGERVVYGYCSIVNKKLPNGQIMITEEDILGVVE